MAYDPMEGFQIGQGIGKSKESSLGRTASYMSDLTKERDKAQTKTSPMELLMLKSVMASPERDAKKAAIDQKSWERVGKLSDPMLASSRSSLGMAANGNLRADRAMTALNNPLLTNQGLQNAVADIAGIYAGGAPSDMGMKHAQYDTLQSKIAGMQQYITGQPQDSVPPKIRDYIKQNLSELKNVNNEALKTHFAYQELANKDVIAQHQDEWDAMKRNALPDEYQGENDSQNPLMQGIKNVNSNNTSSISPVDALVNKWKPKYGRKQ